MCGRTDRAGWFVMALFALLWGAVAWAETFKLELKRLEPGSRLVAGPDFFLRASQSQSHFLQLGLKGRRPEAKDFAELIHKEPKYQAAEPVRGVFLLGGQKFGFALDAIPIQPGDKPGEKPADQPASPPDAKSPKGPAEKMAPAPAPTAVAYNRLYFDRNRNGDLTDDPPVDGKPPAIFGYPRNYAVMVFPAVDVKLQAEGTTYDYAFFVQAMSYASAAPSSRGAAAEFRYVQVSLDPAVYRHGTITLDGQSREVYLTDFNANGRFDDAWQAASVAVAGRPLLLSQGDMLMFGPPPVLLSLGVSPYDVTTTEGRHPLSQLVCLDRRFYELKVTPSGDQLTLTATQRPMGSLRSPHRQFQALLYGELGFVKIAGGDKEIPIPAGQWRVASYTLDLTAERRKALDAASGKEKSSGEPAGSKEGKPPADSPAKRSAEGGLLSALARSLAGAAVPQPTARRSGPTIVSATSSKEPPPIAVPAGEAAPLAFGPPYKPVVTIDYASGDQVHLAMTLVGSAAERCTNLLVDGTRPAQKPEFTIRDPQGNVVQQGTFEYG